MSEQWLAIPLGETGSFIRGISYSGDTLRESDEKGIFYFNMKSFLKNGGLNKKGIKYFVGGLSERDYITKQDVLIANTDVTRSGDIIGAPVLPPENMVDKGAACSHHVTVLRLEEKFHTGLIFYLLQLPSVRQKMRAISRGTTVLMLDPKALKSVIVEVSSSLETQEK